MSRGPLPIDHQSTTSHTQALLKNISNSPAEDPGFSKEIDSSLKKQIDTNSQTYLTIDFDIPLDISFSDLLGKALINPYLREFLAKTDSRFLEPNERHILFTIQSGDIKTLKSLIQSGLQLSTLIAGKTIKEHLLSENKNMLMKLFDNESEFAREALTSLESGERLRSDDQLDSDIEISSLSKENTDKSKHSLLPKKFTEMQELKQEFGELTEYFDEVCKLYEKLSEESHSLEESCQKTIPGTELKKSPKKVEHTQHTLPNRFLKFKHYIHKMLSRESKALHTLLDQESLKAVSIILFSNYLSFLLTFYPFVLKRQYTCFIKYFKFKTDSEKLHQSFLKHFFIAFTKNISN